MNQRIAFRLGTLLILLLVVAFQASAQEATIVGTVTDPTGALVPSANITITNTDTGLIQQFQSNTAGEYVAPSLHIGHYLVRAEAAGFKLAQRKDVVLQVGDRIRLDFKLEIGSASEQITVEAAPRRAVGFERGQQHDQRAAVGGHRHQWPEHLFARDALAGRFQRHERN